MYVKTRHVGDRRILGVYWPGSLAGIAGLRFIEILSKGLGQLEREPLDEIIFDFSKHTVCTYI